jgi:hypothetical protein
MEILDNLPSVTIDGEEFPTELFGAGGELLTATDGKFTLTADDIEVFELKPPLHYSSAVQGDIALNTKTIVTDGDTTAEFDLDIIVVRIWPDQESDSPKWLTHSYLTIPRTLRAWQISLLLIRSSSTEWKTSLTTSVVPSTWKEF